MSDNTFLRSPVRTLADEWNREQAALPQFGTRAKPQSDAGAPSQPRTRSTQGGNLLPPPDLAPLFEQAARKHGVPANVLMALAQQESSYRANAVGVPTQWGRAKGIMQYIDPTARGVGIDNPFDAAQSIDAAARQYAERIAKGYSHEDAIMAHHGGDNRRQWGPKTRAYLDSVRGKANIIGGSLQEQFGLPAPEQGDQSAAGFGLDPRDQVRAPSFDGPQRNPVDNFMRPSGERPGAQQEGEQPGAIAPGQTEIPQATAPIHVPATSAEEAETAFREADQRINELSRRLEANPQASEDPEVQKEIEATVQQYEHAKVDAARFQLDQLEQQGVEPKTYLDRLGRNLENSWHDMVGYMDNTLFMASGGQGADTKAMSQRIADKMDRIAHDSKDRTEQQKRLDQAIAEVGDSEGFLGTTAAFARAGWSAIRNPEAFSLMVAESAATSVPTLGGSLTGAGSGAAVGLIGGPKGAAIGAVWGGRSGMLLGSASVVAGEEMEQMIGERLSDGKLQPTAENIQGILDDPEFREEARVRSAKAGLTYAAVEAIFAKVAGSVAARPGRTAANATTKQLAGDLGISEQAARGLLGTPAGRTVAEAYRPGIVARAAAGGGAIGVSSAGEAVGEASRQQVARGEIDKSDVAAEWVGSFGHSAITAGLGYGFEVTKDRATRPDAGQAVGDMMGRMVDGTEFAQDADTVARDSLSPDRAQLRSMDAETTAVPEPQGPVGRAMLGAIQEGVAHQVTADPAGSPDGAATPAAEADEIQGGASGVRVTAKTSDGDILGTVDSVDEDGTVRLLSDEGMMYEFAPDDGVEIVPATRTPEEVQADVAVSDERDASPEPVAPVAADPGRPRQADQEAVVDGHREPARSPAGQRDEGLSDAAPAAESRQALSQIPLEDMTEAQLRDELKAVAQARKDLSIEFGSTDQSAAAVNALQERRRTIEKALNARARQGEQAIIQPTAEPIKWFGSQEKAQAWISKQGTPSAFEIVPDGRRFNIVERTTPTQTTQEAATDAVQGQEEGRQGQVAPTADLITKNDGSPFASEAVAKRAATNRRLSDHVPVEVDGGWALSPIYQAQPQQAVAQPSTQVAPAQPTQAQRRRQAAERGRQRARDTLGADVGDTITPTTDVGYSRAGQAYEIESISKDGSVYVKNVDSGSSTIWSPSELSRAKREGVAFNRADEDQQQAPARRDEGQREIYDRRVEDITDPNELRAYIEKLRTAVMTDERTGLGSNRAWIERTPKAHIASIDLDSLKWVNDNMGHQSGDRMIELVGQAMREAGIAEDAYHVSGDEFYAQSNDLAALESAMETARQWLSGQPIEGEGTTYTGPGFSYGIGTTIESAEGRLHEQKQQREVAGERAARGERPRGVADAYRGDQQPGGVAQGRQEAAADRQGERAERSQPAVTAPSDNTIFTEDAAEKARAVLRAKLSQLNAGVDPEAFQAGITLAGYHIEKGARAFGAYARAMIADMGDGIRPYLKQFYMGVKYDPRAADMDGLSGAAEVDAFDITTLDQPALAAGRTETVATPSGREFEVRHKVVEAADLITSNDESGKVNPSYPSELQPRDRSRAASQGQIADIASNINPRLLGSSANAAEGAPIVSPGNVVESGNGRTLAVRMAYRRGFESSARYRDWLTEQGHDVEGMTAPVLVRERITDMTQEELRQYTTEANERTTLELSPSERAAADAEKLGEIVSLYRGGDLASAANRDFVRAFVRDVVAQADRGGFMDGGGMLSPNGRRRMEAALVSRAYGDGDLVVDLFESVDSDIKAIGGALLDVAGVWAQMRQESRDGVIASGVDVTPNLLEAVNLVRRARSEGRPIAEVAGQDDIFSGEIDQTTLDFLSIFYRGESLRRARGRDKVAGALQHFTEQARATKPGTNLFGDPEVTGQDVLRGTNERLQREEQQATQQSDIFASPRADDADAGEARGGRPRPQPATEDATPAAERDAATDQSLTDRFYRHLQDGSLPGDNNGLRRLVAEFDGAEVDNARLKQAQEDLEAAMARYARDVVAEGGNNRQVFDRLHALYESQPNLNIRTSTSVDNQAYSTPAPLAFLAARLAGIDKTTRVYEPTAGNGMLLLTADPAKATANEIESQRFANLQAQGFDAIQGDALEVIESGSVVPKSQDAVITNPPFGSVKDESGKATKVRVDGFRIGKIDHLIAAEALKAMKDDGRATLIIGADKVAGGISADDRIFFNWLYGNYNVVGHFEVDGKLYNRQGAGWPVRVIAIDGRQASGNVSPAPGTISRVNNWEGVYESFEQVLGTEDGRTQPDATAGSAGVQRAADDAGSSPNADARQAGATAEGGRGIRSPRAPGNVERTGTRSVGDRAVRTGEQLADSDTQQRPDERTNAQDQLEPGDPRESGATSRTQRPAARADAGEPAGNALADADNAFQTKYTPRSSRKDENVLVPVNMAQPLQDALSALEDAVGDIDQFAATELGYDSVEALHDAMMGLQVDSVASAIHQIKDRQKGVIIADQTGIGKGRQAAAMIRWAERNNYIPVFVTVKPQLFTDMYGDLADIGTNDIAPFLLNQKEWVAGPTGEKLFTNKPSEHRKSLEQIASTGALPEGRNALFMTYSQINTDNVQRRALSALADRAVFILDESHNAGGESNTGQFIRSTLENAPGAVYLSATYAKRPDNMPVYFKTDIGSAISDGGELMQAMAEGGLPLQTVVANNLVKAGQMFRRERSFDGVSIETVVDTTNRAEHEQLSDEATTALRAIVDADKIFHNGYVERLKKELEAKGQALQDVAGNQAAESVNHSEFSSVVHNFVRQMLLGLKANTAADSAIASLKRGEKPLIALENTMGSFLNEYADNAGLKPGDNLGDFDYRNVLSRALERTRYIVRVLPNGEKQKEFIPTSKLDSVTRAAYEEAQRVIDGLDISIPVSPLDWIRNRIEQAGYSVAEITGRNLSVDYSGSQPVLAQVPTSEQNDKVNTTRMFNDGSLDAIILNVSGSTGISLHASEKFADQRKRHMVVAQPAQDINIFMQMLGRVHRTGQVQTPSYEILNADLPAEKRPTALLNKKMKSLNANTSSNTESATSIKSADMLNKYGDQVIGQYLQDDPDLAMTLGLSGELVDSEGRGQEGIARKVTGRMALMPVQVQKDFYGEVESQYSALLDYLNETNQNDLEPRTFDYEAEIQSETVIVDTSDPGSPFGDEAVYGEYRIKAQGKQMTPDEVRAEVDKNLGGMNGNAHAQGLIDSLRQQLKAQPKREGESAEKTDAQQTAIGESFIANHPIGSAWRIEINGDVYNAVVTNIRNTHRKTGNPFSLSKNQLTLAVNGPLRTVTIPASQWERVEIGPIGRTSIDTMFSEQVEGSQLAKIITGNLLAAYGEIRGAKGTIISFTKKDGSIEQGILLPKKFDVKANTRGDFQFRSSTDVMTFMERSNDPNLEKFGIATRDGVVRLRPKGSRLVMAVPKSKARGGKWFLDKSLTAMTGDFVSSGQSMVATFPQRDAGKIIDHILSRAPLYAPPSMVSEVRQVLGLPSREIRSSVASDQSEGLSAADLRAELHRSPLGAAIDNLISGKRIVLHNTVREIAPNAPIGAQAATSPDGTIHMFADGLSHESVTPVLLHEAFHGAVEPLVGSAQWNTLQTRLGSLYRQAQRSEGRMNRFYREAMERIENAEAMGDRMTDQRRIEEFGAYAIEQYESAPASIRKWVDELMGALKHWLQTRFGIQAGQITPAQLRALAVSALRDQAETAPVQPAALPAPTPAQAPATQSPFGYPGFLGAPLNGSRFSAEGRTMASMADSRGKTAAQLEAEGFTEEAYAGTHGDPANRIYGFREPLPFGGENYFGGIFASADRGTALSHGDSLQSFRYKPESFIDESDLTSAVYSEEGMAALNDIAANELGETLTEAELSDFAEFVAGDMSVFSDEFVSGNDRLGDIVGYSDNGEIDWALQGVRGHVARKLGYSVTEMRDEHGTSLLLLGGEGVAFASESGAFVEQTQTPAFKRWFGDSKVVDESGQPLVVYHGTSAEFTSFDKSKAGANTGWGNTGLGFYFIGDRSVAQDFARDTAGGEVVVDAYLAIQKPLQITRQELFSREDQAPTIYEVMTGDRLGKAEALEAINEEVGLGELPDLMDAIASDEGKAILVRDGYDGVFSDFGDGNIEYVAFEPSQIKSATGNTGAFEAANPDIRYSIKPSKHFKDLSNDQKSFLDKIGPERLPQRLNHRLDQLLDNLALRVRQAGVDRYAALLRNDQALYGESTLEGSIASSSWVLARMSHSAGGAVSAMLESGRIYLDAQEKVIDVREGTRGLGETLRELGTPQEIDRFMGWIAANRGRSLMAEGRENLFTSDEIDAGIKLSRGKLHDGRNRGALYMKSWREFQQYRDDVLGIAEDTGIITPEQRETWSQEFYVPFYRVLDDDTIGGPRAQSGLSRQQAFKKLKGGKQNLNDLLENTLLNFHHLLQASLKNQAAAQAVQNARELGIASPTTEAARDKKLSSFVLEEGVKQWYNIDDPLTFKAISALGDAGLNTTAMKIGRTFKRTFTNLTTITPQFIVANLLRDSLSAMATSPTSGVPFKNAVKGAITYGNSRTRARMLASGGAFSFGHIYGQNADEIKASLRGTMREARVLSNPALIPGAIRHAWRKYNEVTNFAENVNRAGIWERNMGQGKLRASFEARDLMDFSAHGDAPLLRVLIDLVPFMNARIQGLDKLYRSGFKPGAKTMAGKGTKADKKAFARFATVAGALSLFSMALYLRNHDDEEYRKLEDWHRDTYWYIRVGDNAFFIPKPFEVGAIATMAERLLEQFVDPTVGGDKMADRLKHTLMDTFALNPMPQALRPVYELATNEEGFTGRPIESMGMERLSPSLRARPTTSTLAQGLSSGMEASLGLVGAQDAALSPVQIDHLVRGYLGQVGASTVAMSDVLWRGMMGDELPARRWSEYQPIRRFYKDLTLEDSYTRYGTDFYEALKEVDRIHANIRHLEEYGDLKKAQALASEHGDKLAMRSALNAVRRDMSELNAAMRRVQLDKEKTGEEKRMELDRLRAIRNMITERVGQDLEAQRVNRESAADRP